jgi:hypothetical protein
MEQSPSNMPVMEYKPGPAGWLPVWIKAVTKPNEQTFIEITEHPDATSKTAFIWMFVAGTFSGVIQAFLQAIYGLTGAAQPLPIPGLEEFTQTTGAGDPTAVLVGLAAGLCLSPVAGLVTVVLYAVVVAIMQWVAKMFGGVGTFDKLAYAIAAISVPVTLVSMLLALLAAIPYVGLCFSIVSIGVSIYALVLQIMAVKGVNRFGWGQAIGTVFLPGLAIFLVCCCVVFGASMLFGVAFNEIFQNMQFAP